MVGNKKLLVITGIVVVLLLVLGGVFVLSKRTGKSTQSDPNPTQSQVVGKLSPEEIGLKLVSGNNNQRVRVIVEKVSDIKALEYDISYDADIPASELAPGETGGKVERGFSDEAMITSSQSRYESKDFDLGSCSRNVCRYDKGIEEVRIILKVTKRDGSIYEVKDSIKI